jgi:intein/homing endonuclease
MRRKTQGEVFYMAVNIEFFRNESPELAYILGLWASDGCVYENRMQLQMNDYDVIEWVAKTIGFDGVIKEVELHGGFKTKTEEITSIGYLIRFRSNEVRDIFNRYGITPRKSLTLEFPKLPSGLMPHFIRGFFDGDGGIYLAERKINGKYYKRSKVHFTSGSIEFLQELKNHIESYIGNDVQITKGTGCFIYAFEAKKDVKAFGSWIYSEGSFGAERKRAKFAQLGVKEAI